MRGLRELKARALRRCGDIVSALWIEMRWPWTQRQPSWRIRRHQDIAAARSGRCDRVRFGCTSSGLLRPSADVDSVRRRLQDSKHEPIGRTSGRRLAVKGNLMESKLGRVRTVALVIVSLGLIAMVGGTAFATGHSSRARVSAGVSKSEVRKIVKSYIQSHKAQIQGPKPKSIQFSTTSNTTGTQTVSHIGPWVMGVQCGSEGVSVEFTGPGTVFGTNTLATTNGDSGRTFETFGGSISFGVANDNQGSQTVELVGPHSTYTVTYFENAESANPVDCVVAGYAMKV
jgi:hypothetical protein